MDTAHGADRVHLGSDPGHDVLQPVRHRRRRRGQQHLPAHRHSAAESDDIADLRDRSQAIVLGQEGRMVAVGLRYPAPERLRGGRRHDLEHRWTGKRQGRRDRRGGQTTTAWKFWGNFAYVDARYADYDFTGGSFSGNAPPNVPQIVANAGVSYRFETRLPVELGLSARNVGNRFNSDGNTVTMDAYTVADAYVFVDIPKSFFPAVDQTRVSFRVRNLFDRRYAVWGDPFYPDQILLGAPRTFELAAVFKW